MIAGTIDFADTAFDAAMPPDIDLPDLDLDLGAATQLVDAAASTAVTAAPVQPVKEPVVKAGDCLYFDIETVPDWDREPLFGLPPVVTEVEVTADDKLSLDHVVTATIKEAQGLLTGKQPSEAWLDALERAERSRADGGRAGIFVLIAEKRRPFADVKTALSDRIKLLSVTPMYARICAIGTAIGNTAATARICRNATEEREALHAFWMLVMQHRPLVGFNCRDFDLQVILLRSAILKVYPPLILDRSKYRSRDVVDVMTELYGDRCPKGHGLKPTCRMLGIVPPVAAGETEMEGSQVYDLFTAGKFNEIASYCATDVTFTQHLHRHFVSGFFAV